MEQESQQWNSDDLKRCLSSLSDYESLLNHVLWRLPFKMVMAILEARLSHDHQVTIEDNFWRDLLERRWVHTYGLGIAVDGSHKLMTSSLSSLETLGCSSEMKYERLSRENVVDSRSSFCLYSMSPGIYRLSHIYSSQLTKSVRSCSLLIHGSRQVKLTMMLDDPLQSIKSSLKRIEAYFMIDRFSTCHYHRAPAVDDKDDDDDHMMVVMIERVLRPNKTQIEEAKRRKYLETNLQDGTLTTDDIYKHINASYPNRSYKLISCLTSCFPNDELSHSIIRAIDLNHSPFHRALFVCSYLNTYGHLHHTSRMDESFIIFNQVSPGYYQLSLRLQLYCPEQVAHLHITYYQLKINQQRQRRQRQAKCLPTIDTPIINCTSLVAAACDDPLMRTWINDHVLDTSDGPQAATTTAHDNPLITSNQSMERSKDQVLHSGYFDVKIMTDKFVEIKVGHIEVKTICDLQIGFTPILNNDLNSSSDDRTIFFTDTGITATTSTTAATSSIDNMNQHQLHANDLMTEEFIFDDDRSEDTRYPLQYILDYFKLEEGEQSSTT